jgi:hypothetical protein
MIDAAPADDADADADYDDNNANTELMMSDCVQIRRDLISNQRKSQGLY